MHAALGLFNGLCTIVASVIFIRCKNKNTLNALIWFILAVLNLFCAIDNLKP